MNQTYSTKELAQQLGYTTQSVRNAMKQLSIEPEKRGRVYSISQEQAKKIAESFGKSLIKEEKQKKDSSSKTNESFQNQIETLNDHIKTLKNQIEIKDRQIESMQNQIDSLLETNKALSAANAINTAADKKELLVESTEESKPKRKGFFAWLLGND